MAQTNRGHDLTKQRALWRFSTCFVSRASESVAVLLEKVEWGQLQRRTIDRASKDDTLCGTLREIAASRDLNLLRGAMAGSMFASRYANLDLPDYSGLPDVFSAADFMKFDGAVIGSVSQAKAAMMRQAYRSFGECVFRRMPRAALGLLQSELASEAENARISELTPVLSTCVPAEGGEHVRFTRIGLRAIVGEGAYAVDEAYRGRAK